MAETVKLPETKPYRVSVAGAIYNQPREDIDANGKPIIAVTRELALFGQKVELTEREALRLTKLEAVKPADAPLSYEEMDDDQLKKLATSRGLDVRGTGFDNAVTRDDLINASRIYDQAHGNASGVPTPAPETATGALSADQIDALSGADLDQAVEAAGIDASTGGSKADGGLNADEKRAALKERAAA